MNYPFLLLLLLLPMALSEIVKSETFVTVAGQPHKAGFLDSKARASLFETPNGLALLPDDSLLIADTGNFRVRRMNEDEVKTFAGSGKQSRIDSDISQEAAFAFPDCLEVLPNGAIIVGDSSRVRMIDTKGKVTTWLDFLETVPGSPAHIVDLLVVAESVYLCDRINRRIYVKRGDLPPVLHFTCEREPRSIAQKPNGDILIGEYERIIGVKKDGSSYIFHQANKEQEEPLSDLIVGMQFDASGNLIIADAYCGLLSLTEGQPAKVLSELNGEISAIELTRDKKKVYVLSGHSIALVNLAK